MLKLIILLATISVTLAALPCDSNLRIVLPHLFTHCGHCNYSPWSSWKTVAQVNSQNCVSQKAITERRVRYDYNNLKSCENKTETNYTCKCQPESLLLLNIVVYQLTGVPTIEEKVKLFVKALDLGLPTPPTDTRTPATKRPTTIPPATKRPTAKSPATKRPTTLPPARPPYIGSCPTCFFVPANYSLGKRSIKKCPTGVHKICENTYSKCKHSN